MGFFLKFCYHDRRRSCCKDNKKHMRALTALFWRSVILTVTLAVGVSAWAQPYGYSVNSRGDFKDDSRVFALWQIDLASGAEEYIGWTGKDGFIDVEGLAFDAEGRLYGTDDDTNTLVRISIKQGNAVPVGGAIANMRLAGGQSMDFGLTFTCTGDLLVSSASTRQLYRADVSTGRLELIGDMGQPIVDLASRGETIYGIGLGTDSNGRPVARNLYTVDPETAAATLVGPLGPAVAAYNQAGLATDEDGQLWAITDRNSVPPSTERLPSQILRIDPQHGRAEVVAETIVGVESLAIAPASACDAFPPAAMAAVQVPLMPRGGLWLLGLVLMLPAGLALRRVATS